MTSALWGVLELMTHDDRGEGVQICQNGGDVICGCPLTRKIFGSFMSVNRGLAVILDISYKMLYYTVKKNSLI